VYQALGVQPRSHAGAIEQRHRALLQHAGADAAEDVFPRALLEDDAVDAGKVKELARSSPQDLRR